MFKTLTQTAQQTDWQTAVQTHYGPDEAYLWTVDDHRAIAALAALPHAEARVLDLTCGRGTYTFALAGACRAIYATDPDPDAVRFLALRAKQSNITNILPFIGPPALRPASLDLILARNTAAPETLTALIPLLKPGGRLCLGLSNPRSPLCKIDRESGVAYKTLKKTLSGLNLNIEHWYTALPDHNDTGLLLNAYDSRGLVHILKERYPWLAPVASLTGALQRIFRTSVAPGYWVIAGRDIGPSLLEQTIIKAMGKHIEKPPVFPIIYANRGTFTLPIFASKGRHPLAIFRMEAARSLVHHEASVLCLIAERADPPFLQTLPQILWKGAFGSRKAALQTALKGRPLPSPKTIHHIEKQLYTLSEWLTSLYNIPLAANELINPHMDRLYAIYKSQDALEKQIANPELSQIVWQAITQLKSAGLRPTLMHGDLHPANIFVQHNQIKVIDWEYATRAWISFDWFHYICSIILDTHRKAHPSAETALDSLKTAFSPPDPRASIIQKTSSQLLQNIGLDPTLYPQLITSGVFDFLRRRFKPPSLPVFLPLFNRLIKSMEQTAL